MAHTSQPLNPDATADDVLQGRDLSGMHAVVTGATGGLGLETARALAAAGAAVTLTGRTDAKIDAANAAISEQHPDAELAGLACDLSSLVDIERAAGVFAERGHSIDVLINNAGVMNTPLTRTADGFEMQFGTNHLGHFALTARLAPALSEDARVVVVSSAAHHRSTCDLDDLNWTVRDYDKALGYAHSKTANIWFASELQRRWAGTNRLAFSLHPGVIATDLVRHTTDEDRAKTSGGSLGPPKRKTIPQGAATSVYAATAAELAASPGAYLVDCGLAVPVAEADDPRQGYAEWAFDEVAEASLWQHSETLTGVTWP